MEAGLQLGKFFPYRVSRLAERVSRSLSRVYADRFAITIPEWRVLATLADRPGLTASAVAALTNLDKVAVSRALSQLQSRQLVRRRASKTDRRASELRLSAAGARLFEKISPLAQRWEVELLTVLSPSERGQLFMLLDRLEERLEDIAGATAHEPAGQEVTL